MYLAVALYLTFSLGSVQDGIPYRANEITLNDLMWCVNLFSYPLDENSNTRNRNGNKQTVPKALGYLFIVVVVSFVFLQIIRLLYSF